MDAKTATLIIVVSTLLTQVGLLAVYKKWCDKF